MHRSDVELISAWGNYDRGMSAEPEADVKIS
jgi:hypothetical protein